jgi:hypothetical protein
MSIKNLSQSLLDAVSKVVEKRETIPTYQQVLRNPSLATKKPTGKQNLDETKN